MDNTSIPSDGSQAIAPVTDSSVGSRDTLNETKENDTTSQQKDSKDTQVADDLAKARAEASNLARIHYETMKQSVADDPGKIMTIYQNDKKLANKIVKSLWADKGYNSVEELLTAVEEEKKYSQIKDPNVLSATQEIDKLRKEIESLKSQNEETIKTTQLQQVYKKFPDLSKENDPNDERFTKFNEEYAMLDKYPFEVRIVKAYKLAFGDEDNSKQLSKSLGNLPTSGAFGAKRVRPAMSDNALKLATKLGHTEVDIKRFLDKNK